MLGTGERSDEKLVGSAIATLQLFCAVKELYTDALGNYTRLGRLHKR